MMILTSYCLEIGAQKANCSRHGNSYYFRSNKFFCSSFHCICCVCCLYQKAGISSIHRTYACAVSMEVYSTQIVCTCSKLSVSNSTQREKRKPEKNGKKRNSFTFVCRVNIFFFSFASSITLVLAKRYCFFLNAQCEL